MIFCLLKNYLKNMLDRITAQKLSKELQIDIFTIYREYLQLLFLKYFYSLEKSEKIYFKGGTAIRFLFDSFRFSEDLDFTSAIKKPQVKTIIKKAIKTLSKEEKIEFKELESIAGSFTGKIYQNFSEFNFPLTIRLDISLREKPIYPDTNYLETVFPISPYPLVSHLSEKEILAEKIRALIVRKQGRDIFDLWFLLSKKIAIDWQLVNKKMDYYKRKTNSKELIKTIRELSDDEIKNDLAKFLPISQRKMVSKIKKLALDKLIAS